LDGYSGGDCLQDRCLPGMDPGATARWRHDVGLVRSNRVDDRLGADGVEIHSQSEQTEVDSPGVVVHPSRVNRDGGESSSTMGTMVSGSDLQSHLQMSLWVRSTLMAVLHRALS
jgi:hypothetical protein